MDDFKVLESAIDLAITRGVFNRKDVVVINNSLLKLQDELTNKKKDKK
tara:strand:- start:92 stop:235 length:144 start_codon:yes stop_codon:yes gene_type:complete